MLMKRHWPILLILVAYLVVGALYALYTPAWQVPDEPAHYNYVRSLVEAGALPVMEAQDYEQSYIERLTSERFPPELPITPLTYEDHQPPLYYLLQTPVYWLSGGSLRALRLFSLLLGGVVVVMTALIGLEVFPDHPGVAWLAGGLVAFLPQHVAMMAGVNNDALTEALLALWLLLALRYLRSKVHPVWLSVVMGLLLVTKTTGYVVLPLALLVVLLRWRRGGLSLTRALQQALWIFLPGLLMGSVWWVRNLALYGWPDFMGLLRHDEVVVGQPRTAAWIEREGLFPFLRDALRTTFRSFWGQFGWMGVVLDRRIYIAVGWLSALAGWGALWQLVECVRRKPRPRQRDALILFGVGALITFTLYLGYNLTFVQHQGRYLYPALPALALAAAVGLRRLVEKRLAVVTALLLLLLVLVVGVAGLLRGDLPLWSLALMVAALIAVLVPGLTPLRLRPLWGALLLLGLWALALWSLFGFILPDLTRS
ncbi:MAG: glycosyltransferase family 39 protein [Anaerolineales bacterium]